MIDTQLTTVNLMTIETVDCTLALFLWAELAEAHSYIVHKVFVVVYAIRPEIRKDLGLNKLVSDFLALRKKGAVGSQKNKENVPRERLVSRSTKMRNWLTCPQPPKRSRNSFSEAAQGMLPTKTDGPRAPPPPPPPPP